MEATCCGSDDFWHDAATVGCAVWGIGRFFFGIAISCAASPLTGAICTKIIDGACVIVAAYDAAEIIIN